MSDDIASLVFPVFRTGIEIKQGLHSYPRSYEFATSHAKLLGLLHAAVPQEIKSEFFGEYDRQAAAHGQAVPGQAADISAFLGILYALACWLDEIFIRDTAWRALFNTNKIETALFHNTGLRYEGFWHQAEIAKNRASRFARDTLEVYYLCVMLGFRGMPIDLTAWRETVEAQILDVDSQDYSPPAGLSLKPEVPPLVGHALMERWRFAVTLVGLAFVPIMVFLFAGY